ncbi:procathepsin L-like [Anthonomus grandis grandis]|uniref:procathepsin L-like n=1 Tax=Anthonomus grandis grandis TaxID=2921223 RepID=UPI00216587CD|nr:procathepsin L-like [Anthonomus grandis grandis]
MFNINFIGVLLVVLWGHLSAFDQNNLILEWKAFKALHNISYISEQHEQHRQNIFKENLRKVHQHNILYERGLRRYRLGVTPFSDLTNAEYKSILTYRSKTRQSRGLFQMPPNESFIATSIDWRKRGAVTRIKNQGLCGSCWAFSAIGCVESHYFLKHNQLVPLSEQQLIDCATDQYGAEGCNGGELDSGFKYIRDHGVESSADYPYKMTQDTCRANEALPNITKILGLIDIEKNNEEALKAAVALVGPISVAFDASEPDLQFYKGGIYESKSCSQTEPNHAVLLVGYGSEQGVDYWIVKNSWGIHFGDQGYLYIRRGVNQCCIACEASYPIL